MRKKTVLFKVCFISVASSCCTTNRNESIRHTLKKRACVVVLLLSDYTITKNRAMYVEEVKNSFWHSDKNIVVVQLLAFRFISRRQWPQFLQVIFTNNDGGPSDFNAVAFYTLLCGHPSCSIIYCILKS